MRNTLNDAIIDAVRRALTDRRSPVPRYYYGQWNGSEDIDANLSNVRLTMAAEDSRFVPKLKHVVGLSAGDTVMCTAGGQAPLTIIGVVVGDVALAEL